jgi:hypothetical protein
MFEEGSLIREQVGDSVRGTLPHPSFGRHYPGQRNAVGALLPSRRCLSE